MMKFLPFFVLAVCVGVNVQAANQPYVVPIYRVTMNPTTASSTTAETTTTGTTTTENTTTETTTADSSTAEAIRFPPARFTNLLDARYNRKVRSVIAVQPRWAEGFTFEHVCSGTLVDNSAIITTITCIESATRDTFVMPVVGTANDPTSTDEEGKLMYDVKTIYKHPDFNADSLANNIAVLKLDQTVDLSLTGVEHITWSLEIPEPEATCTTSYWAASDPFMQVSQEVVVKACEPTAEGAICSTFATPPAVCPSGANGASLVCNSKLAGVFTAQRNSNCSAALWQYQEISKDSMWIWESVNAAPILNVSFAAILLLVTAMLKNL